MRSGRPTGICALLLVAALSLVACVATPQPIVGSPVPPMPTPSSVPTASPPPGTTSVPARSTPPLDICGRGREAMISRRIELPSEMVIGGARAEMTTHAIGLRNGSYDAGDSVPGGIGLEADEVASQVRAGGSVSISAPPARLIGAQVSTARWAEVTFEPGGLANVPEARDVSIVTIETDGMGSFRAPAASGEYVAVVFIDWQTACLEGHSFGYGRIVVR